MEEEGTDASVTEEDAEERGAVDAMDALLLGRFAIDGSSDSRDISGKGMNDAFRGEAVVPKTRYLNARRNKATPQIAIRIFGTK
mmetsp:Transcript_10842/g.32090  ORF Transcript_10842/g.32090 Transcript_10842/m.32090 type:complete len:84 (+) Transcript_10842:1265-1516(+)